MISKFLNCKETMKVFHHAKHSTMKKLNSAHYTTPYLQEAVIISNCNSTSMKQSRTSVCTRTMLNPNLITHLKWGIYIQNNVLCKIAIYMYCTTSKKSSTYYYSAIIVMNLLFIIIIIVIVFQYTDTKKGTESH